MESNWSWEDCEAYVVTGDWRNGAWNVLLMDSVGCWSE